MCHVSRGTCHLSCVTSHLSRVTCLICIFYHLKNLTNSKPFIGIYGRLYFYVLVCLLFVGFKVGLRLMLHCPLKMLKSFHLSLGRRLIIQIIQMIQMIQMMQMIQIIQMIKWYFSATIPLLFHYFHGTFLLLFRLLPDTFLLVFRYFFLLLSCLFSDTFSYFSTTLIC